MTVKLGDRIYELANELRARDIPEWELLNQVYEKVTDIAAIVGCLYYIFRERGKEIGGATG